MSITIVFQQMIIIFLLIMAGAVLSRKARLSDSTSRQISGIVTTLCNPALLISSALTAETKISTEELLTGTGIVLLAYGVLILFSLFIPFLLHTPKEEHFAWRLLSIYGNVGFIGIPLASAVLGSESLIYVSLSNLVYNILIYTHGIATIKKAAGIREDNSSTLADSKCAAQHIVVISDKKTGGLPSRLRILTGNFLNIGTVSALLTILLYISDIRVPVLVSDTLDYVGRSTTFLSMLVLGVSVAHISIRDIFSSLRLYLFTCLRMIVVPAVCVFLFRLFTENTLIISTTILMLAVPAGNMPLILSQQYGLESKVISRGIILSTLLSLITIPIVSLFIR